MRILIYNSCKNALLKKIKQNFVKKKKLFERDLINKNNL